MDNVLLGLSLVVVLSILARLAGSWVGVPAIVPLLLVGVVAGVSVTGWIDPASLLGDSLSPIVQIAVGIILFEGALSLKRDELGAGVHRAVVRLLTFGVIVTWLAGALAVSLLFDVPREIAVLIGAILIVSGPTVVLPILDFIAPDSKVRAVLKWEGVLVDPIGAIIAVTVFGSLAGDTGRPAIGAIEIVSSLGTGLLAGGAGALLLMPILGTRRLSGRDKVAATLMMVVAAFAVSDAIFEDSGLVATIVMGAALANQKKVKIDYIAEFKETLVPLLIGVLFVLLAANVDIADVVDLGLPVVVLILILVLIARPLAVAGLSGLGFSRSEKTFFAFMAPRGIVAASTASAFGLSLTEDGLPGAELIIPITFAVIAGTVFIYGFGAPPLARYLGLAGNRPPALLMVGAPRWALDLGAALSTAGANVKVWTEDEDEARAAQEAGLVTFGGPLDPQAPAIQSVADNLAAIALVSDDDTLNQVLSWQLAETREPDEVYRLRSPSDVVPIVPTEATALFHERGDAAELERRIDAGQKMVVLERGQAAPEGTIAVASIRPSFGRRRATVRLASERGGRLRSPEASLVALGPVSAFTAAGNEAST
jgi:NhaP-type Na+/H+ or K+/H+ antiporter